MHCGADVEHAFQCTYCEQSVCGDHRLPENHDCPMYVPDSGPENFAGDDPDTPDRRSTYRKRIERVREKETSKRENRAPEARAPQSKGDYREGSDTNVLTCPTCGEGTDEIVECDGCGQQVCPACEGRYEHECPAAIVEDGDEDEDGESLFARLWTFLR